MRHDFVGECDFCGAHGEQVLVYRGEMSQCADRGACHDRLATRDEGIAYSAGRQGGLLMEQSLLQSAGEHRRRAAEWRARG